MINYIKILVLFLFTSISTLAQNLEKVDSIVKLYPRTYSNTFRLSQRILKDFSTEHDKARAIFTWIAFNVSYDVEFYQKLTENPSFTYNGNTDEEIDNQIIKEVLFKRKAVCDGYSKLFDKLAKEVGFKEISVDLIYGTPGESKQDWQQSIDSALALPISHISAYALIVEEGTKLAAQIKRGEIAKPDDDLTAEKYIMADQAFTAAGFNWYELSNWAKPNLSARCMMMVLAVGTSIPVSIMVVHSKMLVR